MADLADGLSRELRLASSPRPGLGHSSLWQACALHGLRWPEEHGFRVFCAHETHAPRKQWGELWSTRAAGDQGSASMDSSKYPRKSDHSFIRALGEHSVWDVGTECVAIASKPLGSRSTLERALAWSAFAERNFVGPQISPVQRNLGTRVFLLKRRYEAPFARGVRLHECAILHIPARVG